MAEFLESLVPKTKALGWYPLNQTEDNGTEIIDQAWVNTVLDASGNGNDLIATGVDPDNPLWRTGQLNGRKTLEFGGEQPLKTAVFGASADIREVYIVCKMAGAAFGANDEGILSDQQNNPEQPLTGDATTTLLRNYPPPSGFAFEKSGVGYAAAVQQMPFAAFELVHLYSDGWLADVGLQVGQEGTNAATKLHGEIAELLVLDSKATATEESALNLYFNYKYRLFQNSALPLMFPSPSLTGFPLWEHFNERPKDWSDVTIERRYEDQSRDFNEVASNTTRQFEIRFTGVKREQADVYDAFNDAARRTDTFNLYIERTGETVSNCRIVDYDRTHSRNRSWVSDVRFDVAQYV